MAHRIGLLASHGGTTAGAVIDACADGHLDSEVALVVCNNPGAAVLESLGARVRQAEKELLIGTLRQLERR